MDNYSFIVNTQQAFTIGRYSYFTTELLYNIVSIQWTTIFIINTVNIHHLRLYN